MESWPYDEDFDTDVELISRLLEFKAELSLPDDDEDLDTDVELISELLSESVIPLLYEEGFTNWPYRPLDWIKFCCEEINEPQGEISGDEGEVTDDWELFFEDETEITESSDESDLIEDIETRCG